MRTNSYIERTYFTLEEIGINRDTMKALCVEPESDITAEFIELFFLEYGSNWAIYEDVLTDLWSDIPDPKPSEKNINSWKDAFKFTYRSTFDRYKTIIDAYTAQKSNLLAKLETASTVKYNDTPQDLEGIPTDGFNSTVTKSNSAIDPGEMVNRLRNIERNFSNVYKDWIDEFKFLFGEAI